MVWKLIYLDYFKEWLESQEEDLQDEAFAQLGVLEEYGPLLGRPKADTLYDSKLSNLKELRFSHRGAPIRILFAFDPKQEGVIILGGDKTGDKRWYETNIPKSREKMMRGQRKKLTKRRGKGDDNTPRVFAKTFSRA